ncbi:MAG: hypothetical protein NTW29_17675 [Bacteroidetes bacterium]|nr:hypothetical protein [Bacteroidota bacterium]
MDLDTLQKRKLELEIRKLNTPWWYNIEFWKTVIPTIAVLATLYFTFGKGIMDREKSKLELQKEQLKLEILQFQMQKKTIEDSIQKIIGDRAFYQHQADSILSRKDSLIIQTRDLAMQLFKQKADNRSLRGLYSEDKSFYESQLKEIYELEKKYLTDLDKEKEVRRNQERKLAQFQAKFQYLLKKATLSTLERYELDDTGLQAELKISEKHSVELNKELEAIQKKYQDAQKMLDTMSVKQIQRWFEVEYRRLRN